MYFSSDQRISVQIIIAMYQKKSDAFVEHLFGMYVVESTHIGQYGMKRNLVDFLYFAMIAGSTYWMRKLTIRGACDMNTGTLMTEFDLQTMENRERIQSTKILIF